jgi:hypothetical protein
MPRTGNRSCRRPRLPARSHRVCRVDIPSPVATCWQSPAQATPQRGNTTAGGRICVTPGRRCRLMAQTGWMWWVSAGLFGSLVVPAAGEVSGTAPWRTRSPWCESVDGSRTTMPGVGEIADRPVSLAEVWLHAPTAHKIPSRSPTRRVANSPSGSRSGRKSATLTPSNRGDLARGSSRPASWSQCSPLGCG